MAQDYWGQLHVYNKIWHGDFSFFTILFLSFPPPANTSYPPLSLFALFSSLSFFPLLNSTFLSSYPFLSRLHRLCALLAKRWMSASTHGWAGCHMTFAGSQGDMPSRSPLSFSPRHICELRRIVSRGEEGLDLPRDKSQRQFERKERKTFWRRTGEEGLHVPTRATCERKELSLACSCFNKEGNQDKSDTNHMGDLRAVWLSH